MAYTGPFPFTNAGTITSIQVANTSFAGNVGNTGKITPGGVTVTNSTIAGEIFDSGSLLAGGISLDATSKLVNSTTYGIFISGSTFGGGISNAGLISAKNTGILVGTTVTNFSGGITNSGTITVSGAAKVGIEVDDPSTFTGNVVNSGAITSTDGTGIYVLKADFLGTFAGGVTNSGTIHAHMTGLSVISNGYSGNFVGGVTNSGTIVAGSTGISIAYNGYKGTFTGGVTNSGAITSGLTGLYVDGNGYSGNFSGGVANSGNITTATSYGIYVNDNAYLGSFLGGVSNSGTILSNGTGIYVKSNGVSGGAFFGGGVTNSGAITAQTGYGILVSDNGGYGAPGTFSGGIVNTATIHSYDAGLYLEDNGFSGSFLGGIINSGNITSTDSYGAYIYENAYSGSFLGGISNSGAIHSYDAGLYIESNGHSGAGYFDGGIINSGNITSTDSYGAYIYENGYSTFSGGVVNTATILAYDAGLYIESNGYYGTFAGGIINSGNITSTDSYGAYIYENGYSGSFLGGISNSGAIHAYDAGLYIESNGYSGAGYFGGGIINSGNITSTDSYGAYIYENGYQTFAGGISNSGAIDSYSAGLYVEENGYSGSFLGGVINSGSITASTGTGIYVYENGYYGSFLGGVTNSGTIVSEDAGLYVEENAYSNGAFFDGGVVNSGNITSTDSYGIYVYENGYNGTFAGGVSNSGAIDSYDAGLYIESNGYSGTFLGGVSNSGSITASTGTGIYVNDNGYYRGFFGGVSNSGTIQSEDAGIYVDDNGYSGNFTGGVINSGIINSTDSYGIYVNDNGYIGTFAGGITNSGPVVSKDTGLYIDNNGYTQSFLGGITNTGSVTTTAGSYGIYAADNGYSGSFLGGIVNSGNVSSPSYGVYIESNAYAGQADFAGGIFNSGAITSGSTGLYIYDNGYTTFSGGITNTGNITVTGPSDGMYLEDDGYSTFNGGITNAGVVSSGNTALWINDIGTSIFNGNIINTGTLSSASSYGLYLDNTAGSVPIFNGVGATIAGTTGFYAGVNANSVSLYDAGFIGGTGGTAIQFSAGINTLSITPTYNIAGNVLGHGSDQLQLTGTGTGAFNLSKIGTQYTGFTGFYVASGIWQETGTFSPVLPWNLEGGTFDLQAGSAVAGDVNFTPLNGGTPILELDTSGSQVGGKITGFGLGDGIDLGFLTYSAADTAVWNQGAGTLTIKNGGGTTVATLNLTGSYTSANFKLDKGANNTLQVQYGFNDVPNDFNGNGKSDMLWRQSGTNTVAMWLMNGSGIASSGAPTSNGNVISPDSSWSVAGIADFTGNSPNSDILWRQSGTNTLAEWLMNGTTIKSSAPPTFNGSAVSPDSSWSVVAMGDFNGSGSADILWQQSSTNTLALWNMAGSTINSSAAPTSNGNVVSPDSTWSVAGTGDFNGDGKDDILWRQSGTNVLADWQMSGSAINGKTLTSNGNVVSPDSTWSLAAVGDFNGDGMADMVWRQSGSNTLAMWLMNGSAITSSAAPTSNGSVVSPDSTWKLIEAGDFNGDGKADLIWQQSTTGALVDWQMNGSAIVSSTAINSSGFNVQPNSTWTSQANPTHA